LLNDPAQAVIESEKLRSSSDECLRIINELNGIIDELPTVWEGVSAKIFIQNNRQIIERLTKIRAEMQQITEEIKTLATS